MSRDYNVSCSNENGFTEEELLQEEETFLNDIVSREYVQGFAKFCGADPEAAGSRSNLRELIRCMSANIRYRKPNYTDREIEKKLKTVFERLKKDLTVLEKWLDSSNTDNTDKTITYHGGGSLNFIFKIGQNEVYVVPQEAVGMPAAQLGGNCSKLIADPKRRVRLFQEMLCIFEQGGDIKKVRIPSDKLKGCLVLFVEASILSGDLCTILRNILQYYCGSGRIIVDAHMPGNIGKKGIIDMDLSIVNRSRTSSITSDTFKKKNPLEPSLIGEISRLVRQGMEEGLLKGDLPKEDNPAQTKRASYFHQLIIVRMSLCIVQLEEQLKEQLGAGKETEEQARGLINNLLNTVIQEVEEEKGNDLAPKDRELLFRKLILAASLQVIKDPEYKQKILELSEERVACLEELLGSLRFIKVLEGYFREKGTREKIRSLIDLMGDSNAALEQEKEKKETLRLLFVASVRAATGYVCYHRENKRLLTAVCRKKGLSDIRTYCQTMLGYCKEVINGNKDLQTVTVESIIQYFEQETACLLRGTGGYQSSTTKNKTGSRIHFFHDRRNKIESKSCTFKVNEKYSLKRAAYSQTSSMIFILFSSTLIILLLCAVLSIIPGLGPALLILVPVLKLAFESSTAALLSKAILSVGYCLLPAGGKALLQTPKASIESVKIQVNNTISSRMLAEFK